MVGDINDRAAPRHQCYNSIPVGRSDCNKHGVKDAGRRTMVPNARHLLVMAELLPLLVALHRRGGTARRIDMETNLWLGDDSFTWE